MTLSLEDRQALDEISRLVGLSDPLSPDGDSNQEPSPLVDATPRVNSVTLESLLARHFPPRNAVLAPLLREKDICMVYARRGVGKTWFSLALCAAVATGGEFLGWHAPKPRPVLYVDGEMPGETLQSRLAAIVSDPSACEGRFKIFSADLLEDGIPNLASREGQEMVERSLEPGALVWFDNLSCLFDYRGENDAESWTPAQAWFLKLRRQGFTVGFDHHAGKAGTQRGTSRREDILDLCIRLAWPSDYTPQQGAHFTVDFEKARGLHGESLSSLDVRLDMVGGRAIWTHRPNEHRTLERVVELANEGLSQKEIALEIQVNKSTVSRQLRRAREEGLLKGVPGARPSA